MPFGIIAPLQKFKKSSTTIELKEAFPKRFSQILSPVRLSFFLTRRDGSVNLNN